jgi:hypothetical protein
MLIIEVTNPGLKIVTINAPHLRLPDGRSLIMPIPNSNIKFPFELGEGKNAHVWLELKELKQTLLGLGLRIKQNSKLLSWIKQEKNFIAKNG